MFHIAELQSEPRKRKRCLDENTIPLKTGNEEEDSSEAFSSTPKKFTKRFTRSPVKNSTENQNPFFVNTCLEVKSIYDIAQQQKLKTNGIPETNPFEVVRKPPKKKKKESEMHACFVNPALNLAVSEKHFNPFEVLRDSADQETPKKGFVNAALNIRGQDVHPNPFEVTRPKIKMEIPSNIKGIENQALEIQQPAVLQIGLPFAACVGCRINFKDMPLQNLTPSKLLAEKLVFSPVPSENTPRSLSTISEETLDIGRELDRYQLELENSINEKKIQNENKVLPMQSVGNYTFVKRLADITETDEGKASENNLNSENEDETTAVAIVATTKEYEEKLSDQNHEEKSTEKKANDSVHNEEESIADSSYNDDSGFIAPAPFVRAYRKPEPPPASTISRGSSKESLQSNKSDKSNGTDKQKSKVKSMIRNSIRRLIHPNASHKHKKNEKEEKENNNEDKEKENQPAATFMETIRHSLRRKPQKSNLMQSAENNTNPKPHDVSIIDTSERIMKLKTNLIETDYMKIEELTTETKPSIRNSIRKSTRGVRNQIMKSVFHKDSDEFIFKK